MRPVPGLRVTLISRARTSIYSGMMPGHIAGRYDLDEISVNLDRLCVLGGHRLLVAEIEGLDPIAGAFHVRGRPPVRFDTASVNVGVTPDLSAIPGAAEHATPVKPLEGFVRSFAASAEQAGKLCIIGGGAGGVELALALSARFGDLSIDIVQSGPRLLPRFPTSASRWAARQLTARGVRLHLGQPAQEVTASGVRTAGQFIEADQVLAVTPARAPDWLAQSGLRTDSGGFITVDASLRSVSHPNIFGAGDCADMQPSRARRPVSSPCAPGPVWPTIFAAWQKIGPPARSGCSSAVCSCSAMARDPRWRSGAGSASALAAVRCSGSRIASTGAGWRPTTNSAQPWSPAWRLSRRASAARAVAARSAPTCCRPSWVPRSRAGDVALLNDHEVASVDLLRDGFDDPFLFGKVAAVHALSDLHAAGATNPRLLAALTLPYARSVPLSRDLEQVQAGLESAGVPVIGGHTAEGSELSAAVTVVGDIDAPDAMHHPAAGDSLILTKPLGVGLILAARMVGRVLPQDVQAAFEHCEQDNAAASAALADFDIGLRTDVTGFGLLGHLLSSLPEGHGAVLDASVLPLLTGARDAFDAGVRPSILSGNQRATAGHVSPDLPESLSALLHDPQTSGGLLLSLPAAEATKAVKALRAAGYPEATEIGHLKTISSEGAVLRVEVTGSWV